MLGNVGALSPKEGGDQFGSIGAAEAWLTGVSVGGGGVLSTVTRQPTEIDARLNSNRIISIRFILLAAFLNCNLILPYNFNRDKM